MFSMKRPSHHDFQAVSSSENVNNSFTNHSNDLICDQTSPISRTETRKLSFSDRPVVQQTPKIQWPSFGKLKSMFLICLFSLVFSSFPLGFGEEDEPARRCLAILLIAAGFWLFEPIPPYVTSLFVAFLIVISKVLRVPIFGKNNTTVIPVSECPFVGFLNQTTIIETTNKLNLSHDNSEDFLQKTSGNFFPKKSGELLSTSSAAQVVSQSFFDPLIFLFISGFTMGQALEKFQITERLATIIFGFFDEKNPSFILVSIFICCVVSMGLSNVTASVLLTSVVAPLARKFAFSNHNWAKQLVLSVAFGCNLGGMISPIASPQNLIALVSLRTTASVEVSFFEWCCFSIPFCFFGSLVVFFVLQITHPVSKFTNTLAVSNLHSAHSSPGSKQNNFSSENFYKTTAPDPATSNVQKFPKSGFSKTDLFVVSVVLLTVILWTIFEKIKFFFGNMGIVGLVPVLIFHGVRSSPLVSSVVFTSTPLVSSVVFTSTPLVSSVVSHLLHSFQVYFSHFLHSFPV